MEFYLSGFKYSIWKIILDHQKTQLYRDWQFTYIYIVNSSGNVENCYAQKKCLYGYM